MLLVQTDVGDGPATKPSAQPAPPCGEHTTSAASFCLCNILILEERKTNMGKKKGLLG
jgi:hypothetical protein